MENNYKYCVALCVFIVISLFAGYFLGLNKYSRYDVNRDGKVSASDYVAVRNYLMEEK